MSGNGEMKWHPAAELFPLLEGEELKRLKDDIKKNGLIEPIKRLPDGTGLDGRNRWLVCHQLEIKPRFETVDPADPFSYIMSQNLHRRNLSSAQRAAIVVNCTKLVEALEAEAKERVREGGQGKGQKKSSDPKKKGQVRDWLAKLANTNPQYIDLARRLIRAKDCKDVLDQIISGEIGIEKAKSIYLSRHPDLKGRGKAKTKKIPDSTVPTKRRKQLEQAQHRRHASMLGTLRNIPEMLERVDIALILADSADVERWTNTCVEVSRSINKLKKALS